MEISTTSGVIKSPYGVVVELAACKDNYRPLHSLNSAYDYTVPVLQGLSV